MNNAIIIDIIGVPSQIVITLNEALKIDEQLSSIFNLPETWFSCFKDSPPTEIMYVDTFKTNTRSAFSYLTKSIHNGKLLKLTSKNNIKDITDLCTKLGLDSLIPSIMVDGDSLFEFCLNTADRKIIGTEKMLRKKLFSNEQTDYRSDDHKYIYQVTPWGEDKKWTCEEEDLFLDPLSGYMTLPCLGGELKPWDTDDSKKHMRSILKQCPLVFDQDFVIAGGSVNTCLTSSNIEVNDIDIFFITKDQNAAEKSMYNNIVRILAKSDSKLILRTENSITVKYKRGTGDNVSILKIQFILRLYNSITQVISGFDVDASCAAFDGQNFYVMPRYIRAI